MATLKRLLSIVPYPLAPTDSAGRKSILQFNNWMARHAGVTVLSVPAPLKESAVQFHFEPAFSSSMARYFSPRSYVRLRRMLRKTAPDFILFEHPYMAWMGMLLGRRRQWGIRSHNIEYERFRSFGKWWWRVLRAYELLAYRKAGAVFFITEDDAAAAGRATSLRRSFVMPTGMTIDARPADKADCRAQLCAAYGISAGARILLYNGALGYGPNRRGLDTVLEEINPRLENTTDFSYKILVCGSGLDDSYNELAAYGDRNIIYCGFVPDITVFFKGADVYLNPIIGGGGIKTRLVEALAYNTNAVSTRDGAIGLYTAGLAEKVRVVADGDWDAFAAEAVALSTITTPPTPAAFYEYYYWGGITDRFVTQVNSILS